MLQLDQEQSQLLAEVFATLAERKPAEDLRLHLGTLLMRLLRADHYASYIWDERQQLLSQRVALNVSESCLQKYEAYYRFHDPITPLLRARFEPTLVTQVMAQEEFMRTEIYNELARPEGVHWIMHLHVRVAGDVIGDLRFGRGRARPNFGHDEIALLGLIKSAFCAALRPAAVDTSPAAVAWHSTDPAYAVTPRERAVASLAAEGLSDKAIADSLGISPTTVRSHLRQVFRKLQITSRAQLARLVRARP